MCKGLSPTQPLPPEIFPPPRGESFLPSARGEFREARRGFALRVCAVPQICAVFNRAPGGDA